jgi:hypothetical protein
MSSFIGLGVASSFLLPRLDFAALFLNATVGTSLITLFVGEIKLCRMRRIRRDFKTQQIQENEDIEEGPEQKKEKKGKKGSDCGMAKDALVLLSYYTVFFAIWGLAFYYFAVVGTSNKNKTPADSRYDKNLVPHQ